LPHGVADAADQASLFFHGMLFPSVQTDVLGAIFSVIGHDDTVVGDAIAVVVDAVTGLGDVHIAGAFDPRVVGQAGDGPVGATIGIGAVAGVAEFR